MEQDAGTLSSLLKRLLRDDASGAAAWQLVVSEYSGLLLAVTRKTFATYGARASNQDIEDAVSEVWKNLLEKDRRLIRVCIERGNFLQTVQVLARNRSVDIMRRRQMATLGATPVEDMADPGAQPAEPEHDVQEMLAAVRDLPSREKLLVQLFFLQGKKYREISELTGIPQNSIGPTLARALARLRRTLVIPE